MSNLSSGPYGRVSCYPAPAYNQSSTGQLRLLLPIRIQNERRAPNRSASKVSQPASRALVVLVLVVGDVICDDL